MPEYDETRLVIIAIALALSIVFFAGPFFVKEVLPHWIDGIVNKAEEWRDIIAPNQG